ncbi:MAG: DUF4258 domain-containing protein [Parvularculaceae bacterium]|nr:DUF4258 domain-containing protein [Parvularculaceae bacterium]
MAELITTRHARLAMERRGLSRRDVRAAVYDPDEIKDGKRPGVERRVAGPEGRRVVAVVAIERRHLRLITAYIDARPDPQISLDDT